MKSYLVFRLYGALASWGVEAVGKNRPTSTYPTRSAILGLLGAALGIRRDDETQLAALQQSVKIAIKQVVSGLLLRDYHTAQVPSQEKKQTHQTRKSELSDKAKLNTVLSSRDYLADGVWVIAISLTEQASLTLPALRDALIKPVFTLSLGRKSCPPALPMSPKLAEYSSLKAALDTPFPSLPQSGKSNYYWRRNYAVVSYWWEGDKNEIDIPDATVLTHQLWNEPLSRDRWQFTQHTIHQVSLPSPAEEGTHVPV
ncbi:type I-E CRISPR-associated protein Cas5/CasD [Xenorhabdus sp. DI]|uniref:type I-E CRISPR-associated protein Cas5/CasD n=1 Tax=Xenorhabdus doucetiae TaxID=351671 RepID=UPI0019BACC9A|nr:MULTISPECIES: type I-E CRISPR-associated protein Cas5/CasD [unclassified Xenorhabdus]MBD2783305.1 type I-E CRISPR-associated protein Cas5/CasD [Xenorhabdus sp. 3]MBD2788010.1 type I-E CRISPR-associated protein Cas5/CasD [Xenorhabdus sp. DI]